MRAIWRNFLTGLLVIFPAVLTIGILKLLWGGFAGWVINPFVRQITPWVAPGWATIVTRAAVLIGFVFIVAGIGFATRILVFRRFLHLGEELLRRVPMVGKIYGTIREIANVVGGGGRGGVFTRVVLVEWPRPGIYTIGFVTSEGKGELQAKTPGTVVNVFVPTTPNPTSGYLVLADRDTLIPLTMSVEDGMKLVISGGVVGPEVKATKEKTG